MAEFLGKQGVWMAWDYGDTSTHEVKHISEDPIAIMVFIAEEGMYFPGFWPERMELSEAIGWWRGHASEYIPRDNTQKLEDAKNHYEQAVRLFGLRTTSVVCVNSEGEVSDG